MPPSALKSKIHKHQKTKKTTNNLFYLLPEEKLNHPCPLLTPYTHNTMVSIAEIHNNIVASWRAGQEETLYKIIDVKTDGTVTIRGSIMETTFDPHGSEERLRKFLATYVR